jgi:hypothetical protein
MRHNRKHASTDPEIVRQLIGENPWAIIATTASDRVPLPLGSAG